MSVSIKPGATQFTVIFLLAQRWMISGLAAGSRVVLLGQQPEIVGDRDHAGEQLLRLVTFARQHIGVRQPERAGEERAFAGRQAVVGLVGAVAQDEAVLGQLVRDRQDGGAQPLVVRQILERGEKFLLLLHLRLRPRLLVRGELRDLRELPAAASGRANA